MKRIKIAFINPPHADWSLINPVTWMLCKSFYQHNGKYSDQVEWLEPPYKYNEYQSIEEIYELIKDADIIMFSSYVWNYDLVDQIAQYAKQQNPSVINLLGGPMIGAKDPALWIKRSMYDYILRPMFPGEFFVKDVLDLFIENKLDASDITYEVRSTKQQRWEFPLASAYEENLDYLKKISAYGIENEMELMMVIETTRGCPFSCTYCEWGGGIGGKIIKKEVEWAQRDCVADEAMKVAKRTDMKVSDKIKLGKYMRDLCAKYDYHPGMELIMAMPGSTLEDFYAEWELFYDLGAWSSWRYDLMALPDSEISDPVYQEIYAIELVDVYTDNVDEQDIANTGGLFKNRRTFYKTVASSYSFSREDVAEMFFMNFAGNNLIREMYDLFKDSVTVSQFAKHCWEILKTVDGFDEIYAEVKDILNPDTPARNINTINGVVRTEAIPRWVASNKLLIMNELFGRIK